MIPNNCLLNGLSNRLIPIRGALLRDMFERVYNILFIGKNKPLYVMHAYVQPKGYLHTSTIHTWFDYALPHFEY